MGDRRLAARNSFLVRIDPAVLDAVKRWAADELRSVNGQIEYILRRALDEAGRLKSAKGESGNVPSGEDGA